MLANELVVPVVPVVTVAGTASALPDPEVTCPGTVLMGPSTSDAVTLPLKKLLGYHGVPSPVDEGVV